MTDKSTDNEWEAWGRRDPYFGVITNPKFRKTELTPESKREFFESGHAHADYILQMVRLHIGPHFVPKSILDFGCGVGRLVIPFAKVASEVVGMDVSPAMLEETRRNCDAHGLSNVQLILSDDELSRLTRKFDLIHSYIVFQHIPADRGRMIFRRLLEHLPVGGVGALHFCYSKNIFADTNGIAPPPPPGAKQASGSESRNANSPGADPEMQMNCYHVNELLFLMQQSGVSRFHVEFTDHGGELGILVFFQKST